MVNDEQYIVRGLNTRLPVRLPAASWSLRFNSPHLKTFQYFQFNYSSKPTTATNLKILRMLLQSRTLHCQRLHAKRPGCVQPTRRAVVSHSTPKWVHVWLHASTVLDPQPMPGPVGSSHILTWHAHPRQTSSLLHTQIATMSTAKLF